MARILLAIMVLASACWAMDAEQYRAFVLAETTRTNEHIRWTREQERLEMELAKMKIRSLKEKAKVQWERNRKPVDMELAQINKELADSSNVQKGGVSPEIRKFVQPFHWVETPKTITPPQTPNPKYLLALRYWGSVSRQREDAIYFDTDWIYLYEVYATKEEVLSRLQQPCEWDSSSVVGCWSLTDDRRVEIKYREVPHEKKREIVTDKWIEKVWEIK